MTNPLPAEALEQRAAEQRLRLHNSVTELRNAVRRRFDPQRAARDNFPIAALVAAGVMLLTGYSLAGIFTRD